MLRYWQKIPESLILSLYINMIFLCMILARSPDQCSVNVCFLAVVVEFQHSSHTVNEFEREVEFTIVKRTHTTESVSVVFTTMDGSAIGEAELDIIILAINAT